MLRIYFFILLQFLPSAITANPTKDDLVFKQEIAKKLIERGFEIKPTGEELLLDYEPINNDFETDYVVYIQNSVNCNVRGECAVVFAYSNDRTNEYAILDPQLFIASPVVGAMGPNFIFGVKQEFNSFITRTDTGEIIFWSYDQLKENYVRDFRKETK